MEVNGLKHALVHITYKTDHDGRMSYIIIILICEWPFGPFAFNKLN